ncbi:MAG: inositol monophosphatase [Rhodospirillales bacterium]|nr:inositol monophosphatase [Rhodospirillales bacterium]
MTKHDLEQRYLAACAIAYEAGDLARRRFEDRASIGLKFKGPQDYLTAADGEVERLIIRRIGEAFPDDACYGEEGGGTFGSRVWVIDPIDGTANFARGVPHFCISIAFVDEGKPAVGAIYSPATAEMFAARRGGGATCNGRPMQVSTTPDLKQATIELGWSTRRPMQNYLDMMARVAAAGASFRRAGSGALGIAYVADGRADGYCELHINSWDALAGLLMVEEAGGWINDFLAHDGLAQGNPVVATTPILKDAVRAAAGILG